MTSSDELVNPSEEQVEAIIDAYDALVAAVEAHLDALEGEYPVVEATGDVRHRRRLDRGTEAGGKLLNVLEGPVLDHISELRHVAGQIGVARQGKMV